MKKRPIITVIIVVLIVSMVIIVSGCGVKIKQEDANKISSIYVKGGAHTKGDKVISIIINIMPRDENRKPLRYTTKVPVTVELINRRNESIFFKQFKTNKWGTGSTYGDFTISIPVEKVGETHSQMVTAKVTLILPNGKNLTSIDKNVITTKSH